MQQQNAPGVPAAPGPGPYPVMAITIAVHAEPEHSRINNLHIKAKLPKIAVNLSSRLRSLAGMRLNWGREPRTMRGGRMSDSARTAMGCSGLLPLSVWEPAPTMSFANCALRIIDRFEPQIAAVELDQIERNRPAGRSRRVRSAQKSGFSATGMP